MCSTFVVGDVARGIGPAVGIGPSERHIADAEAVVVAQEGKRVLDGVPAFNAHERRELALVVGRFHVRRGIGHAHLVRMLGGLLVDGVDQFKRALGVVAFVEVGLDPNGKELRAEVALFGGLKVEMATVERVGEIIVFVEKALRSVGVRVNHEGGAMDSLGVGHGFMKMRGVRGGNLRVECGCGEDEGCKRESRHHVESSLPALPAKDDPQERWAKKQRRMHPSA